MTEIPAKTSVEISDFERLFMTVKGLLGSTDEANLLTLQINPACAGGLILLSQIRK